MKTPVTKLLQQMQQQALTDGLTGCYNRRAFEMQLERDLHQATRLRQPLSLIMLDFDNFKHVNDQAGHDAGDLALRMFADNVRDELRVVDSAASGIATFTFNCTAQGEGVKCAGEPSLTTSGTVPFTLTFSP